MYGWLIGGLAALDLGIKNEIEREEASEFPRELPASRGWIRLHRRHNEGFPFGVLKSRPELVKAVPVAVSSAVAGALGILLMHRGRTGQKLGLSLVLAGAVSNLCDRLTKGYVVDYFSIERGRLARVIFNLGDLFVGLGSLIFVLSEAVSSLRETGTREGRKEGGNGAGVS